MKHQPYHDNSDIGFIRLSEPFKFASADGFLQKKEALFQSFENLKMPIVLLL